MIKTNLKTEPKYTWTEKQLNEDRNLLACSKLLIKAGFKNKVTKYWVFKEEDSVGVIELL